MLSGLQDYYAHNSVNGDANPALFTALMAIVIGLYSLCFGLTCFTFGIKQQSGSLWLFHTRGTPQGVLIMPNTTMLFTLWASIFTFFSTIYIGLLVGALKRQITSVPAQAVMALIWIPMVLSLFSEAHGMSVAIFLAKADRKILGGRFQVHASLVNVLAILFYIRAFITQSLLLAAQLSPQWFPWHSSPTFPCLRMQLNASTKCSVCSRDGCRAGPQLGMALQRLLSMLPLPVTLLEWTTT